MKAPTQEQLNDPQWWDENDPAGGCDRLFLVWENGCLKRMQWMRGEAMFHRKSSMEVPELHHRPTKPAAPEWNGQGVPPVGVVCEGDADTRPGGFEKCLVVHHDANPDHGDHSVLALFLEKHGDKFTEAEWCSDFRPIRAQAQRDREELKQIFMDQRWNDVDRAIDAFIAAGWRKGE